MSNIVTGLVLKPLLLLLVMFFHWSSGGGTTADAFVLRPTATQSIRWSESFTSGGTRRTSSTQLYGDVNAARRYVQEGMQAFRQGQVKESIQLFDQAQRAEPVLDPYLWQRGLSYYYANDYVQASQQFQRDVAVNPVDVEEIVWDIASQLQAMKAARSDSTANSTTRLPLSTAITLPPRQQDRRPIMNVVYRLFRGEATEHDLAAVPIQTQSLADEFYALFYLGLYCEAVLSNESKAELYLRQAAHTQYAQTVGRRDYMTDCARIHCRLRGWNIPEK